VRDDGSCDGGGGHGDKCLKERRMTVIGVSGDLLERRVLAKRGASMLARGLGVKLAVFFGACNLDLGEGRDNGRWWRSVVVMSDGGQRW
jgi:hypothetical protein